MRRSRTSCTRAKRPRPLARKVAEALRDAGHAVVVNAGGGSFKSQMKKADASGARFALIIGDDEAAAGHGRRQAAAGAGDQVAVPAAALAEHLARARRIIIQHEGRNMAVYDLEEQDQLDDLKAWWARWGNTVVTALVDRLRHRGRRAGLALVERQAEEAAALFAACRRRRARTTSPRPRMRRRRLTTSTRGTGYAPRAALLLAKMQFDAGDTAAARAQLQWVVDHADEQELKEIARYRLAELLLNDKQYDEALKVLDAKHGDPFAGLYADLRGDALAAAGRSPTRAPRTRKRWPSSTPSRRTATTCR